MQARVWGCRGSIAVPGPDTVRYGGNTSCVEVRLASGHVLILDAGTGMRPLGVSMRDNLPPELNIMLTHLHMDHLQGLGFFQPLFAPGLDIHIWGPSSPVQDLAERIAMYLSPPLFPVRLEDLASNTTFHNAPEEPVTIGSASIRAAKVAHQGPTVGYRIEENGRTFVYLPDHEPSLGADLANVPAAWMSGHDIARDADVLLHDGQYRDDEYGDHIGWGHSAVGDTMEFANKANVDRLVLFHHDPYHTDEELEALLAGARRNWPGLEDRVSLAYEGMSISLDEDGVTIEEATPSTRRGDRTVEN
jgi:phosphoribosyl 1,2-cyclic phosphodiesterase